MGMCIRGIVLCAAVLLLGAGQVVAARCEDTVREFNRQLRSKINEQELVTVLRSLNASRNRQLPLAFITKRQARASGWRPGSDLWSVPSLRGKSIGGDRFGNRERRLPDGRGEWREADLDYHGGHRGAKRLLYADGGLRMVTVDHYRSFREVPACE
ncbi:ribonuclease domain-containing protein [Geomobilimonas luticola]|uniref:Ribonuclease n=1 Tax=Geomobilimonas luticola TaxID=1114878 RepID=A0ABS5SEU9_9BACT|nr:ribonuclease domain-containing protein [Geomobilimonas luticola]MBT0653895.1 ribonuclease [Geomobilimonas luticola]